MEQALSERKFVQVVRTQNGLLLLMIMMMIMMIMMMIMMMMMTHDCQSCC